MAQPQTMTQVLDEKPHPKLFPPLDHSHFVPQLVWLALTFGLLYVLLSRIALPRVSEIIDERRDRIQRDLEEAARLKTETQTALASYEKALADAKTRAGAIAKETHDNLAAEVDKERAKVDAQVAQKLAEADKRIAGTKSQALASVNEIATDTAAAIVSKLIGTEVGKDEIRRVLPSAPGE